MIRYSSHPPDATDFSLLYETTGWAPSGRPTEIYATALEGSWACCSAYCDDQLVGFGRIISDGMLHAFLTEMIVRPDFKRQGIGGGIVTRLLQRCADAGINDVQLFCAEGARPFYERYGFESRPEAAPGMQYRGKVSG